MTEFLTLNRSYTFIFSFINSIKSNNSVNNFFIVSTNSLLKKKKFDKNESKPSYKLIHVEQYFGFDLQNNINMTLEAIKYENDTLEILDQLLLPGEHKYIRISSVEDGWKAIKLMQVRIKQWHACQIVCHRDTDNDGDSIIVEFSPISWIVIEGLMLTWLCINFFTLHILYCIRLVALHTIVKYRRVTFAVAIRVIELDSGRYDKEVTRCRKTVRYMSVPSIMSLLSKLFKILFCTSF